MAGDLNKLAAPYQAEGKYAEAEPHQKSYWIFSTKLGPDHPNVEAVLGNYQRFLQTSGQAYAKETVIRKLQEA
ncbi:MAG: tetratricopeptide repeat protein [Nitrospirales bacterium]|nr:tetratricopeptide repeat protein [Nitrospirales bacterium]